ncbi:Gfo/Idh/MocA family oxidoreductase [Alicyclobacillus tolerans]|uniref:Gfo/Idh/MocA family oxidoreductase n=1 Tax=Alicyclobacillus tolerans TaxID=90970 RepID=UPI001F177003|nr:Gfo/Idh/MocA family oxidoreductase [Alicyclobacillus tolerans]MCF8566393.1 Gfo/Idh/MocA family oxidoreductase [Alicyclobacillus tolerans]
MTRVLLVGEISNSKHLIKGLFRRGMLAGIADPGVLNNPFIFRLIHTDLFANYIDALSLSQASCVVVKNHNVNHDAVVVDSAKRGLAANKHVFVMSRPLMSPIQLAALKAMAWQKGRVLMVGEVMVNPLTGHKKSGASKEAKDFREFIQFLQWLDRHPG